MNIVDAKWTPRVNLYGIQCHKCKTIFYYRVDRWRIKCEACGATISSNELREKYVTNGGMAESG